MNYLPDYVFFESLGGSVEKFMRFPNPEDKTWSAFNPSIGIAPDGSMAMTIRSSNYILKPEIGQYEVVSGNLIKNRTWFCELTEDFKISNLREINYEKVPYLNVNVKMVRGAEDAKLFWRDGGWKFTAVLKEPDFGIPIPRIGVFELNETAKLMYLGEHENEIPDVAEKNWMIPYDRNPNFDFIYNETSVVKDEKLIKLRESNDTISNLRGGSNLWDLGDGTYIGLTHKTFVKWINFYDAKSFGVKKSHIRDYHHYFVRYDFTGKIVEISPAFKFINSGVEFGAGLIIKNDEVIVSFGRNDRTAYIGKINLKSVLNILGRI